MQNNSQANNKRIAKNTILLYFRTMFVMVIALYTSRVILNELGVDDYGIFNAVGGVVAMFTVISSALSSSISRFITYELGHGDKSRLSAIFSTSLNIQFAIAAIVLILCEIGGVWFLNCKMSIPPDRLVAANWVLQCSLLSFCVGLISVPYNACIIAHEHMSAFAYISVLEAVLKLVICYMLITSPWDQLITYAVLMLAVSVLIRIVYGVYCSNHFEECHYHIVKDKPLLREMTSFAGWGFFTNMAWVFNTQGVNLLVNVFFGVALNAARGIATQVEGAVLQFVNNFTTAINPQITKCYGAGEKEAMFSLVCRGAKFSLLLLLFIAVPLELETEYILTLWLKIVPNHAVTFIRLVIIGIMVNALGNTGYTACMATGNIKKYVLSITTVGILVFPLTWVAYKLGMPAETTYIIYISVYIIVDIVRLYIMRGLLNFPAMMFVQKVLIPLICTISVGSILPIIVYSSMSQSLIRLFVTTIVSFFSIGLATCYIGLTKHEREMTLGKIIAKIKR